MEKLNSWLRRQYDVPGAKYPSARQLSLAITNGKDQGTVGDIERRGITTFKRARELSAATETPVLQILLMAGLINESEIEGGTLSPQQVRAATVVGDLPDEVTDAWLVSLERLVPILRRLSAARTEDDSSDFRELGKQQ